MEDRKIIERFFARNEDVIKCTDDTYGRRLYLLEDNIVHNGQDAEESVSDVRCEKRRYNALCKKYPCVCSGTRL